MMMSLYEAMSLRDVDLLEEELVIEHAKRMKAERTLHEIAHAPRTKTPRELKEMAREYLDAR